MTKILLFILLVLGPVAHLHSAEHEVQEVKFMSHGDQLSGSIVFPNTTEFHAAVVFVHGSGKQTRNLHWAQRFALLGIVALVYDKRGAGLSAGEYEGEQSVSEQNIKLLADDSIAALDLLSKLPRTKNLPLGLTGISQAGWIIPIAAEKSSLADFMVLWSSPVSKVSEEDIYSKYTSDLDNEIVPSYDEALAARKRKYVWPSFLGKDSDPSDSLAKLFIPGLWIFGEKDGSIPVDLSTRRLTKLRNAGHKFDSVLFSSLGHNNMDETFATAADWILRLRSE